MYPLHHIRNSGVIETPPHRGLIEINHRVLYRLASEGDFVLLSDGFNQNQYLTKIADIREPIEDPELYLVLLEAPIPISGNIALDPSGYVRYWGEDGEGFPSLEEVIEEFDIDIDVQEWPSWGGYDYEPPTDLPPLKEPSHDPEDPDENGGGNGGDGDGGDGEGNGIDRTGTMLSEQYAARDAIRNAAKGTTQATILLFGVVIAGLALFEDAVRNVELWFLLPIGIGILFLLIALLGSSYVLTRTAAFPRPSIDALASKHNEVNKTVFKDETSNETVSGNGGVLQSLSSMYFDEVESIQNRNIHLGRLIGVTVATAVIGTALVFYGALSIGLGLTFTEKWLGEWGIVVDTILAFVLLSLIVGRVTAAALKQTNLSYIAIITSTPKEHKISDT